MKRSAVRYVYVLLVLMFTGFFISGCGGDGNTGHWDGGDGANDTIAPSVTRNYPAADASGVPIGISLTATFNEEMASATIGTTSFTLQKSGLPLGPELAGQVTYTGLIATFNPDSDLDVDTEYTATITTGAEDLAGNALASNYLWTFTTEAALVDASPTVILTDPADLDLAVALNKSVTATFSEAMNSATLNDLTFTLYNGASLDIPGTVTYVNRVATFNPDNDLDAETEYTATISSAVTDLAGNFLVDNQDPAAVNDHVWTFTTGLTIDDIAPTVAPNSPLNGDIDVALNKNVSAIFSESMDPTTIDTASYTLQASGTPLGPVLPAAVSYLGLVATLNPTDNLAAGIEYTATMTTAATDLAGNPLALDEVWTFTTIAAAAAQGPLPVDLGTAADFAVLSKSGISTTGTTLITGNIGVNPVTSTAITGFSLSMDSSGAFATSPYVTGNVYAPDYAVPTPAKMVTGVGDMETAFTDAAGRAIPDGTELYAGNLSGQTFAPGLYKWSTIVQVDPATAVTLSGGANDVWIFQISGDLLLASGARVELSGGAQAKNVFWQVSGGTGVTLEAASQFKGIVLAQNAIVLKSGATVVGRLLAQKEVTLIANPITQP
jgi:hypothetical protein